MFHVSRAGTAIILTTVITVTVMEGTLNNSAIFPAAQKFDRIIEAILIGLCAFLPFAFGGAHYRSIQVFVFGSGLMVFLLLVRNIIYPQIRFTFTWAYTAVLIFILLAAFSVIPLSAQAVSAISPNTTGIKSELLFDNAARGDWKTTLSFYVSNTKAGLRMAIAAAGVFVVVVNVFNTSEKIKRLLTAIVIIGAAVALLAAAQDVLGNGKLYWIFQTPLRTNSGPFVHHSHFAQFMNLCIASAIAMVFFRLSEDFDSQEASVADVFDYFDSPRARRLWLTFGMISIAAATVFVSLSRGGMIAMLFALSFTVLIAGLRKRFRRHGWILAIVALVALLCILYTGFDSVYDRFASLGKFDDYHTRINVVKDMLEPVSKFPLLGTGLGSHEVIYPMFQSIPTGLEFVYAENEYAQLLEEMGIAGFAAAVLFGGIVAANFVKALRKKHSSITNCVYGLGFGITAILVHSISDFGQHLPANLILTVSFCAIIIVLGKDKKSFKPKPEYSSNLTRLCRIVILVFALTVFTWAIAGAHNAASAEGAWSRAENLAENLHSQSSESLTDYQMEQLLAYASDAVAHQPGNVEYIQWLATYRWRDEQRQADDLLEIDYQRIENIVRDLKAARFKAPTYGPVYCLLGQLQKFVLLRPAGEDNIQKGYRLEPNDELTLFTSAYIDLINNRPETAKKKFKCSVLLGGVFFEDMVRIYLNGDYPAAVLIELADDNVSRLGYVIEQMAQIPALGELVETARQKRIELMANRVIAGTAHIQEMADLARYYNNKGDYQRAIEYYALALDKNYSNVYWRLKMAQAMAEAGRYDQALKQCRLCLKLSGGNERAKELLGRLSVMPEVIEQNLKNEGEH